MTDFAMLDLNGLGILALYSDLFLMLEDFVALLLSNLPFQIFLVQLLQVNCLLRFSLAS